MGVLTESGGPGVASTLRRPFPGGIGSGSCTTFQIVVAHKVS